MPIAMQHHNEKKIGKIGSPYDNQWYLRGHRRRQKIDDNKKIKKKKLKGMREDDARRSKYLNKL